MELGKFIKWLYVALFRRGKGVRGKGRAEGRLGFCHQWKNFERFGTDTINFFFRCSGNSSRSPFEAEPKDAIDFAGEGHAT